MRKRIISFMLAGLMILFIFPVGVFADVYSNKTQTSISANRIGLSPSKTTNGISQNSAVEWIKARGNEAWWRDVDGVYGCQCVDLILAYYQYLVGYRVSGHAYQYATNSLPNGWYRDNTPTPGCIVVWGQNKNMGNNNYAGSTGHIGLVYAVGGGKIYTVETNTGGDKGGSNAYARFKERSASYATIYIHPDFPSHTHSYTSSVTTSPTCTSTGVRTYRCSCGASYTESIAALGHSYNSTIVSPTCTSGGYTKNTCSRCGNTYNSNTTSALGHKFGDWVVTTPATGNTDGTQTRTCSRCQTKETKKIPAYGTNIKVTLVDGYIGRVTGLTSGNDLIRYAKGSYTSIHDIKAASGAQFIKPDSKSSVDIIFTGTGTYTIGVRGADGKDEAIFKVSVTTANPFVDVPAGSWYTNAVVWCNKKGYMSGTSETRFSPSSNLTRAMFVQMLYAIEGSPKMKYNGYFADVGSAKWYASAVEWAYSKGITGGTSERMFTPAGNVTREQLATFFYAYKQYKSGKPSFKEPDLSKYTDRNKISGWALTGVKWAISQGILSGTSAITLSPKSNTTRAQSAVVLYSYFN